MENSKKEEYTSNYNQFSVQKNTILLLFLFILTTSFLSVIHAQETTDGLPVNVEQISDSSQGVLDESGLHTENIKNATAGAFTPWKTKTEQRIEEVNKYIGPISMVLFNTELKLSWIFVFSVFIWILILSVIIGPVKEIFNLNLVLSWITGAIIACLVMHGFGDNLALWLNTIFTTWYAALLAILTGIFLYILLFIFSKKFRKMQEKEKKEQEERDRKIIHVSAEVEKKNLESYKDKK